MWFEVMEQVDIFIKNKPSEYHDYILLRVRILILILYHSLLNAQR